jgi:hypothetical protein
MTRSSRLANWFSYFKVETDLDRFVEVCRTTLSVRERRQLENLYHHFVYSQQPASPNGFEAFYHKKMLNWDLSRLEKKGSYQANLIVLSSLAGSVTISPQHAQHVPVDALLNQLEDDTHQKSGYKYTVALTILMVHPDVSAEEKLSALVKNIDNATGIGLKVHNLLKNQRKKLIDEVRQKLELGDLPDSYIIEMMRVY